MRGIFLDTNVLLYAISSAPAERAKKAVARGLLEQGGYGLSVQVLQEFYVNATRGPGAAMTHAAATQAVHELGAAASMVAPTSLTLMEAALRLTARYRISYWDAAIVAAAKELKLAVICSEDLSDGQNYDGVRVENPFARGG